MKFGSLFSGIGGIDLGLERAGMECSWQVEIDPFCQKILKKHWPGVPKYEDVRNVGKHNLKSIDLICGGFPCQPHSLAGKREASNDERDLWPEFYRIICELKPRWVLAENVPGLLSSEAGRFFGAILRDLATSGYDAEWQSIPAAAFGAPHIRERVFIVAHHESERIGGLPISARGSLEKSNDIDRLCEDVSDIDGTRLQKFPCRQFKVFQKPPETFQGGSINQAITTGKQRGWWSVEPGILRMVNGIPHRVDRIRGLGNAVVPQVIEWIGKRIMEAVHE